VNNVRTVSDTKRAFYTHHTRPINSIYRRVVEELMVEMHLLSVNADFQYDAVYALGTVTAFERFMQGYRPEQDQGSIFNALCQSIESDPNTYRASADQLRAEAKDFTVEGLLEAVKAAENHDQRLVVSTLRQVAANATFKYSRLFAIGLYSLLEIMDSELAEQTERCNGVLTELAEALGLSDTKLQKDLELYRSNLDKVVQAKIVMEDILKADRKKKEDREKQRQQEMAASSEGGSEPSDAS
jgi:photosystem II biogenesis protein Psp29